MSSLKLSLFGIGRLIKVIFYTEFKKTINLRKKKLFWSFFHPFVTKTFQKYDKRMTSETLIEKIAQETIQIEADTLLGLVNAIDQQFISAVLAIFESKGRLIVTGIGKSAIVGMKIVATLNSTGTPAIFMHAADAVHGDLGIILKDDVILCISKSGHTSEMKILMSFLKNLGNQTIAMVSDAQSFLAKAATYTIHTPVSKEADPNNLAPTASTTAQMAMGDAIATSLLALRGFTPKDFAQFHPGGSLGKQLYLRVRDIVSQNELPIVQHDASIKMVILEITSKRLGATAVLSPSEKLIGIITDGDLRRMLESEQETNSLAAKDIMTPNPKTIDFNAHAVKALEVIRENSISQLVAMDDDRYMGILHLHDLIREGLV